jgi:hypothetical protein
MDPVLQLLVGVFVVIIAASMLMVLARSLRGIIRVMNDG